MSPLEVAARLGRSRPTIYRLIWSGAFRSTRIGGTWDIDADSVTAYLAAHTISASDTGGLMPEAAKQVS